MVNEEPSEPALVSVRELEGQMEYISNAHVREYHGQVLMGISKASSLPRAPGRSGL